MKKQLNWILLFVKEAVAYLRASPHERRHIKVGFVRHWQERRAFQIGFLRQVGLQPEDRLLDIGCGTLRGGIPLIAYLDAGHYYGIDVRADILEEARRELLHAQLAHKEPQLLHAPDLLSLKLDQSFEFIWAYAVLIHLSDENLDAILDFASRHLSTGGLFYANVHIGDRHDAKLKWQGFPVVWRNLEFYEEAGRRHGFQVTDMGGLDTMGGATVLDHIDDRMLRFSLLEQ